AESTSCTHTQLRGCLALTGRRKTLLAESEEMTGRETPEAPLVGGSATESYQIYQGVPVPPPSKFVEPGVINSEPREEHVPTPFTDVEAPAFTIEPNPTLTVKKIFLSIWKDTSGEGTALRWK